MLPFIRKNVISNLNSHYFRNYSKFREARILQKIIDSGNKKSKINAKSTDLKQSFLGSQSKYENCGKRMKILDKIYMQNISHIMATGRNSEKVLGLGIEITDVKIDKSFQNVKVFWIGRKVDNVEDIKKVLNDSAGEIKHEIITQRFMGYCPEIIFVRDIFQENLINVERILNEVCSENIKEDTQPVFICPLEIEHDVFGLDHSNIMGKIKAEKSKQRGMNIKRNEVPENVPKGSLIPFVKSSYAKFYNKNFILAKKSIKRKEQIFNWEDEKSNNYEDENCINEYLEDKKEKNN